MRKTQSLLLTGLCLTCLGTTALAEDQIKVIKPVDTLGLANTLKQSGNAQAATDILRQRAQNPDATVHDHLALASSLTQLQSHHQAVRALQQAHKKFPEDTEVMYRLGLAYIANKQPQEAVNVLDMLTAVEPHNIMAFNAKAVAFDGAGNHFAAQEIYTMALKQDPNAVSVLNNMAMSLILDNRPAEAVDILEPLHSRAGDNPKVRHNLALAYGLSGKKQQAEELALQDLSEDQVKQNLEFYKQYSSLQKELEPVALFSEDEQMLYEPLETEPEEDIQRGMQDQAAPNVPLEDEFADPAMPDDMAEEFGELSPAAGDAYPMETAMEDEEEEEPFFGKDAIYSYPRKDR